MSSMGTADTSGLGSAFSSGSGGVGSDGFGFTMPSGFDSSGSGDGLAGLTGVGSGMTFDNTGLGNNTSGFSTAFPNGLTGMMPGLNKALGGIGGTGQSQSGQRVGGGSGRVSVQAKNFSAPVVGTPSQGGSQAGNALISLLQQLKVGQ